LSQRGNWLWWSWLQNDSALGTKLCGLNFPSGTEGVVPELLACSGVRQSEGEGLKLSATTHQKWGQILL
jgi:hypothetical protein